MRGKRTLAESLDSYVSKELMDGQNQYHSEQLGKKVGGQSCLHAAVACDVVVFEQAAGGRAQAASPVPQRARGWAGCLPARRGGWGDGAAACPACKRVLVLILPSTTTACQVDAEKRVLFKHLPHTLVLHLKRFEWDYETYQRWKVRSHCLTRSA